MRPRAANRRALLGILAAALVAGPIGAGGAFLFLRQRFPAATPVPIALGGPADLPEPVADWCAPQFEPIEGGGCFAASPAMRGGQPLIVYLHGRYARDAAADEVDRQRRLAARATARGFAVLALRGGLGACTAPELANWFCWPSNDRNAGAAPAFVGAWNRALAAAHTRAGSPVRFLLGFSNGGYFAGLVASRGLLEVDALVVAHGGPVEPVSALRDKPPLLLLSADDDVAQDDMIRFDEDLLREQWAHDSYARSGGHGLTDEDIDAALTFFARAKEPLPLQPPLPLHRAVRHARDAGLPESPQQSNAPLHPTDPSDQRPSDPVGEAGQMEDESLP
jgi:predicted esterase